MAASFDNVNANAIETFGIDATYTPDGGDPQTLRIVFDYVYFQTEGEIGIQARQASAGIKEADAPNIKTGETIVAETKTFTIAQVRPDGAGWIELDLQEVP
jgi:hypothetical protein